LTFHNRKILNEIEINFNPAVRDFLFVEKREGKRKRRKRDLVPGEFYHYIKNGPVIQYVPVNFLKIQPAVKKVHGLPGLTQIIIGVGAVYT
jgi:hypothetical protein